jgi:hypothetical protein
VLVRLEQAVRTPAITRQVACMAFSGILGAFWSREVIEDTKQIAIRICRGELVQTPRL